MGSDRSGGRESWVFLFWRTIGRTGWDKTTGLGHSGWTFVLLDCKAVQMDYESDA